MELIVKMGTHIYILLACLFILGFVNGQSEVCMFYHLDATCRYRIDGICLSEIKVSIDQCTDPIQVKFTITCERDPVVHFSHTFTASDTIVSVRGFYTDVKLRVKLRMKKSSVLNVEADIMAYGQPHTDFMNDDVKLHSLEEACGSLNDAGKIAIGVMAGLFVIAGIMLAVLLVIRRQRKILKATQSRTVLVNEPETPVPTVPHRLSRIEENGFEESANTQSLENSGEITHNQSHSGEVTNSGNSTRAVNQMQLQEMWPDRDTEPSVRYSDIQRRQNEGNNAIPDPIVF